MVRNVIMLVVCSFFFLSVQAQNGKPGNWKEDYESLLSTDLEEKLPGLDTLIQVAMKHSPYVKFNEAVVESSHEQIKINRRMWHDNISAFGNYSGGNQRLMVGGTSDGSNNLLNGYRYGVNVNIPLSTFTTRKSHVRSAEALYKAARHEKEQTELELRNQVIQEYYNLIAAQKILKIKSLALENAELRFEIAEQRFNEGSVPLDQYTDVSESLIRSETEYEEAKRNFFTEFRQFEQLLGMSLKNLMRRR